MKKYIRRDFLITLLQCFVALIPTAFFVLYLINSDGFGFVESLCTVMCASFIFFLLAYFITWRTKIRRQGMHKGITSYAEGDLEEYCINKLNNHERIKSVGLIFRLTIPYFILACLALVWDIVNEYYIVPMILKYVGHAEEEIMGISSRSCGFVEGFCLAKILCQIVFVLRRTCRKCGCFYSFVEYDSQYSSVDYEENRTVEKDIKVGEIRIKSTDEKVGEVRKTVSENQSRRIKGSATTYYFKCAYCGNKTEEKETIAHASKWN